SCFHKETVAMTVIAAVELHDSIATRVTACESDRRHRRFSSRVHQADFLDGWHQPANQFCEVDLAFRGRSERGPCFQDFLETGETFRRPVAKQQRPPRAHVVDIFVTISIPDPRALAANDEQRLTPN